MIDAKQITNWYYQKKTLLHTETKTETKIEFFNYSIYQDQKRLEKYQVKFLKTLYERSNINTEDKVKATHV